MNFEDWLESKGCMDGYGTDYQDAYDEGFDEGQQSQQAKIDCMQVRLDGANESALSIAISRWSALCKERDELQAMIDAALEKCYTGIRKQGGDHYLELVENILKGNKDEL